MPNRLAAETSPYLLQHADNPVDWYPWGPEAFERARAEDKPILLSVGYSSCHWCHVMAHESFEDPATAELMNRYFINVKVDREERPDVDAVYMAAVQAISGQGGWPMTVFLTPEGQPFYAGTYFPPEDAHGRPGFRRVLQFLAEKWQSDRQRILESAAGLTEHLRAAAARQAGPGDGIAPETTERAVEAYAESFDTTWGGFGSAPKFPSPSNLEFLLAYGATHPASRAGEGALAMALHTLRAMATGGMYDQVGGGFARYSVDDAWVVPHFEKMLYDNAQLARLYLHAYQVTGDGGFARVVHETLEFLLRDMRDPAGGFYAALDADSEGIEGKYYLWTLAELERVLGPDAALAAAWYGVTPGGNFYDPHHPELTGRNVLTARPDIEDIERRFGISQDELLDRLESIQERLFYARQERVPPGLDDKVLTSWNGLALAAFAEAGRVLEEPAYLAAATELATFLGEHLWRDGTLYHTWKAGEARIPGMLEDYTYLGLGLVELYRATGDIACLEWARELWHAIRARFLDPATGTFFDAAADAEQLIVRQRSFFDAPTPSGNASAALLGLWLGRYYGEPDWERTIDHVVAAVADHLLRAVTGFGAILLAIEFALAPHREIVIVGEPRARAPFEQVVSQRYLPFTLVAPTADARGLPLFEGRQPGPEPVAYVCEAMTCAAPARSPAELEAQLAG